MKRNLIAACQLPEIRGDVNAATSWIEAYAAQADSAGARLVCFPECFLQGYQVDEASARRHAIALDSRNFADVLRRLDRFKTVLVFGLIEEDAGKLYNTAVVVAGGRLLGKYRKVHLLPGERVFTPGDSCPVFDAGDLRFGIAICYDTQFPDIAASLRDQGAQLIVCPANNMMDRIKAEHWKLRHNPIRAQRVRETGLWLISADVTGTCGTAVGLGPTCVLNPQGEIVAQVPLGEVGMVTTEVAMVGADP